MNVIQLIASILFIVTFFSVFGGWLVVWYYKIKCAKKQGCKNDMCPVRNDCPKAVMTEAEKSKLKEMLKEYQDKNQIEDP